MRRMNRRTSLAAMAALPAALSTALASAAGLAVIQALKPSATMPVLFLGHGSPMNAIEDNPWRRAWQAIGTEILARAEPPQLILCISAHWLQSGNFVLLRDRGVRLPSTMGASISASIQYPLVPFARQ